MEEIKVSVIIPVYNASKYLRQCLDSIISQTLQEIEIICVDDGSTDNSLEILNEYQKLDNRIKVLTQKHKRQGVARNYGMSIAAGEYIGFVDSDDWCEPDMYEKLYQRAKETDSDITMCAVTTYNDNNSNEFSNSNTYANLDVFPQEFLSKVFSPDETLDFLMDICVYPPNKIIRRSFINAWLNAKRISLIKHFGYYYRMYSDTSTSYSNDYNKLQIFQAFNEKKYILEKYNVYKKVKKDFEECKRKCILLWFNKISDKRVKCIYLLLILFNMPSCFLEPLITFEHELCLIKGILFNKNKRIALWGASLFLENFIYKYNIRTSNIVGIRDKNPAKHNKNIGCYMCYPPEKLKELNADIVFITIVNFSKSNQLSIKDFLAETKNESIMLNRI